jgi:quinoprotein glucose dehydrogenase
MPGHNGGANFGTSAVDPDRGEFYVVHKSLPTMIRLVHAGIRTWRGGGTTIVTPEQKAELMAKAKALVDAAAGQGRAGRVHLAGELPEHQLPGRGDDGGGAAVVGDGQVRPEHRGDRVEGSHGRAGSAAGIQHPQHHRRAVPANAPLVTGGGLIFLATGPERKIHAYDRDSGKELWQHSLPNGAEGMPATYQVNGRQFVVLSVAQATGTFPATFGNAAPAPGGQPGGGAGGQPGGAGGRQGRGGGGPSLPSAYIAFALPQ